MSLFYSSQFSVDSTQFNISFNVVNLSVINKFRAIKHLDDIVALFISIQFMFSSSSTTAVKLIKLCNIKTQLSKQPKSHQVTEMRGKNPSTFIK